MSAQHYTTSLKDDICTTFSGHYSPSLDHFESGYNENSPNLDTFAKTPVFLVLKSVKEQSSRAVEYQKTFPASRFCSCNKLVLSYLSLIDLRIKPQKDVSFLALCNFILLRNFLASPQLAINKNYVS